MKAVEFESTMRVLQTVYESETDHDHKWIIRSGMSEIVEDYNNDSVSNITSDPDEKDVKKALELLDSKDMENCYEFVDLSAQYTNGLLPEPRDWTIIYKHTETGEVLEEKSMEYADSESTTPIINGDPHKCDYTEWRNNKFIVYVQKEEPRETPFDISCWDCDLDKVVYTEAEASEICNTHRSNNQGHTPGYKPRR